MRGTVVGQLELERAVRGARFMTGRWVRGLPGWMDREAFFGEALLAVACAAQGYRPERGSSFLHYACTQVRFALLGEAKRQDPVGKWRRARLRQGQGEERPWELPPQSLEGLTEAGGEPGGDGRGQFADPAPGPEARVLARLEEVRVRAALLALDGRERWILHLRYWEGETQTAVAGRLGVSPARVNQLERRALGKLRERLAGEERDGADRGERDGGSDRRGVNPVRMTERARHR